MCVFLHMESFTVFDRFVHFTQFPEDIINVIIYFTKNPVFDLLQVCKYFSKVAFLKVTSCNGNHWQLTDDRLKKLANLGRVNIHCMHNPDLIGKSFEYLANLTHLDLNYDAHMCEQYLLKLKSLVSLKLNRNSRVTNETLLNMTNLTRLNIYNTSHITSIQTLVNLISLNIGHCLNIDEGQLKCLTNLSKLKLKGNLRIRDISGMTSITHLDLTSNEVVTSDTVGKMTNLTSLILWSNRKVMDIDIMKLTKLKKLDLCANYCITDISLASLTNLTKLCLADNNFIRDWSLMKLTNLTHLDLSGNDIITDESVLKLYKLKTLYLASYFVKVPSYNITRASIEKLTNIIDLSLKYSYINGDISTTLKSLNLHGNPAFSNNSLTKLTNLTSLTLGPTSSITVDAIVSLKSLEILDVSLGHTLDDLTKIPKCVKIIR